MNVPVDRFITGAGEKLNDNPAFHAYRACLEGRRDEARAALIRAHYDAYFGDRLVVTTDNMVADLYKRKGTEKPENYRDSDPGIVRLAVTARVDAYLKAFDALVRTGRITRDEPIRARISGDKFVLMSCGYNDVAAWAAAGHSIVPDVVIVPEKEITIGACWDGSDYYSPEYVNILYRSVLRNTTIPFDFVLYVGPEATRPERPGRLDSIDRRIKIVQVGLPFWWCAMPFWQRYAPGVETESVLYLDLDQVILGNIDEIVRYPSNHAYMKDYPAYCCPPGLEGDGNASVSLIRHGAGERVWAEYVANGKPVWNPRNPFKGRKLPLAVQSIVNNRDLHIEHDVFPEQWVSSYRLWAAKNGPPEGCKIVSFHGQPKPAQCTEPWVVENWR